ncbi:hypothetical protein [Mucilaginibacter gotjawali]|uniref:Uncharacterized protein n=2 Tax=Mucilaginibacter gotjawali TaxID=1550579 RepID=A0A120MYA6_9SPHI|nr:hypothetical protein [Mucilaginibacter gotjawali]MBB3056541.1 hypothetical protein [Mucilaginibacter gotjawali]BAU52758.1 hypothetical protein MgSA37_00921 [Mucilaginibacter gotjawali]
MTKLKIQIDKEEDMLEVQAILTGMGLKFQVSEDDELADLPDSESEDTKADIKD